MSEMSYISTIVPRNAKDIFILANSIKTNIASAVNKVYVSIGSKYNAPYVNLNGKQETNTNSLFQMLPWFLQMKETYDDDQSIVIVIDEFNNKTNYVENINLLQAVPIQGTHIIMCNIYCTEEFLEDFIDQLVSFLRESRITSENFLICNFVKFLNVPNDFERMAEITIPETIQRVLNSSKNIIYSERFYDWFGYNSTLYNYIYCYKLYQNHYSSMRRLETILVRLAEDPYTKIEFRDYNETNYWDKIYDLTSYGIDKYRLTMSLREQLIQNNNLEYIPNYTSLSSSKQLSKKS